MPVRLRLQRHGAKKRPYYRLVATDKRNPRDGRFIEMLGTYDPLQDPPVVRMNSERVEYWVGVGAQPSDTVLSLIRSMRRGETIDLSQEGAEEAARQAAAQKREEDLAKVRAEVSKAGEEAKADETEEAEEAKAEEAGEAEEAAEAEEAEETEEAEEAEEASEESEEAEEEASEESEEEEEASDEEE